MKQVFIQKGKVFVEDTPLPLCDENSVLVRVTHSVISVGTELGGIESTNQDSLVGRVAKQPSKALKAIDMVKEKGVLGTLQTLSAMQRELDTSPAVASGYSCSGIVASVGKNLGDLKPGNQVACGGVGKAVHAEVVSVPRNLVVKVPEGVRLRDAASATIGSIALQGVRQANVRIGEYVAVIGLGLIGQITIQILNAAGCRVIGIDLVQEKIDIAARNSLYHAINAERLDPVKEILMYTNDNGVDATIITAASQSDEIVQQAMEMTRKRGTIVVVGAVGLGLKRHPFYRKEIDFKISCSYGPGRYDELYEEKGIDYPYPYVRWTENRNMAEYLRLIAQGKVDFASLVTLECPVNDASRLYEQLMSPDSKHLGVVLTYDFDESLLSQPEQTVIRYKVKDRDIQGKIRVGVIGAGGFAKAVHLPNLQSLSDLYDIRAIASRDSANAKETAKRFSADYATTDYHEVLADPDIDMVVIATRHDLHARMAMEAAQAGKAVFLEKPMALTEEELDELERVLQETKVPFMVGFNRRFSPFAAKAKEIIGKPLNPIMVFYRVNARHLPQDHWVHGPEGGGRIIGEACHMIDFFSFLMESTVASVGVSSIDPKTESVISGDNFLATLKYHNGSVCSLLYTSQGADDFGKEYVEIHADGKTLVIDNYQEMLALGIQSKNFKPGQVNKGHLGEFEQFGLFLKGKISCPISLESLLETAKTAIGMNNLVGTR